MKASLVIIARRDFEILKKYNQVSHNGIINEPHSQGIGIISRRGAIDLRSALNWMEIDSKTCLLILIFIYCNNSTWALAGEPIFHEILFSGTYFSYCTNQYVR